MRKSFQMVILLIIFTLLFSSGAIAKSDNAKKSLVALGDSIPYGYNLGSNEEPSRLAFPYLIGEEANLRVRNLAVPGWKTEDMLNALQNDQKYRQAVRHADYITLNIGSNDLLLALQIASSQCVDQIQFQQCLFEIIGDSAFFTNLNKILHEINLLSDAQIVVYNIYYPFRSDDPIRGHLNHVGLQVLPSINDQIASISFNKASIADAFNAFVIGSDNPGANVILGDIHPSIEGHQVLADIGLEGLGFK
ncbi:SGNH/GDSL hydrolase family protein [Alkalihalobacterium alkalinitrilicum]|uniref:SGNH/GDSL hydrolase family protein n=1 Tax=Alkalihalobacterium alkalinitrilicum TaxID=427920 RepID=UPI0009958FF1|nr:SGNH/GDSL hydrolase family protein [Alkalihalobacterium alkalinitrilicum]